MKSVFGKLKDWLIKKLGGITKDEHKKLYADKDTLYMLLAEKEKEVNSLKRQNAVKSPNITKNETVYVESYLVEPIEIIKKYAIRDFHKEFEMEKVEKSIIYNLTQKIAEEIVTQKLYELMWCDKEDPFHFERVANIRVRIVPPREKWRAK